MLGRRRGVGRSRSRRRVGSGRARRVENPRKLARFISSGRRGWLRLRRGRLLKYPCELPGGRALFWRRCRCFRERWKLLGRRVVRIRGRMPLRFAESRLKHPGEFAWRRLFWRGRIRSRNRRLLGRGIERAGIRGRNGRRRFGRQRLKHSREFPRPGFFWRGIRSGRGRWLWRKFQPAGIRIGSRRGSFPR